MSDIPSTREERIRRFAELDDEEQERALWWFDLQKGSNPDRRAVAAELLGGQPLNQFTKTYLIGLLTPDILQLQQRAQEMHLQMSAARQQARYEAAALGYDWEKRRRQREYDDLYRDDFDYYREILVSESRPTPNITAYVALLREQYGRE